MFEARLTDHSDVADSCASSSSVLQADAVAATVLSLGFADAEAEVAGGAVEADLLIRLQLFIVLLPRDGRGRFTTEAP